MKHILTIYHITIHERRKPEKRVKLDDIDGVSFLTIIDGFIKDWLKGSKSIQKSEKEKKACKLKTENGQESYSCRSSVIEGIIESGEYGREIDVYNVDDGSKSRRIDKRDAPLMPFYFFFSIEEDSYDGYLILQKIGNNGIYSIFTEKLKEYAGKHTAGDYTLSISPFSLRQLRENTLRSISEARSITIQNKATSEVLASLGLTQLQSDGMRNEIRFYLGPGKTFEIPLSLKNYYSLEGQLNVLGTDGTEEDGSESDLTPDQDYEISMEVKMPDGNFRKLTLGNMDSLGTSRTLPDDIECNDNGFPTMEALKSEAYRLLDIIKKQTE